MKARRLVKLSIATARALKRIPDLKAQVAEEEAEKFRQEAEVKALVDKFQRRNRRHDRGPFDPGMRPQGS